MVCREGRWDGPGAVWIVVVSDALEADEFEEEAEEAVLEESVFAVFGIGFGV